VDVEDVAAGHEFRLRWNDQSEWLWSDQPIHEPIVSSEEFEQVAVQMTAASRPHTRKRHHTKRSCVLSGLVRCAVCGHRMQGNANHR
jgi:hypothetical protein